MTQEDKELLFKDLCARLPYGVICHYDVIVPMVGKVKSYDRLHAISEFDNKPCFQFMGNRDIFNFDNVRPYLFPMSSMTDEQKRDYQYITERWINNPTFNISDTFDWLNKNHFDYRDRGLIQKGLALDATGLNIYQY